MTSLEAAIDRHARWPDRHSEHASTRG